MIPALILVAVSLWEAFASARDAREVPDDTGWAQAAAVVRAGYRPGDLIVFAPAWAEPIGRLHLGDLISLDDAARMDAARYARIWELSIRDARAPDTGGLTPAFQERVGGVAVRRYEQTPVTVLSDVRGALASARVEGAGRPTLELAELGFTPRRCVQIVPTPGRPARITFPGLELGAVLVGHVGLADVFTRRDIRAPGRLEIEIGGRRIADVTVGVDDGWVRFEARTSPGPADVTFVASASASQRQICFAAEARR